MNRALLNIDRISDNDSSDEENAYRIRIQRYYKLLRPNSPKGPMNLLSCPQEMLASVLKYTTFETVTRIRKTNKQMNYVATKYRINLLRVHKVVLISYGQSKTKLYFQYGNADDCKNDFMTFFKPNIYYDQQTAINGFEDLVGKIRSLRCIWFHDSQIDVNMIDFLQRTRITKKCSLFIQNCNFSVTLEKLTTVLAKYKNSDIFMQPSNKIMNEPLATEVVMISLLPYSSICVELWLPKVGGPAITDETLRVARKYLPHAFEVPGHACFSLKEIKKTMLYLIECYKEGERKLTRWQLGSIKLNSKEELRQTVLELMSIPGIEVDRWKEHYAFIMYKGHIIHGNLFEASLELR